MCSQLFTGELCSHTAEAPQSGSDKSSQPLCDCQPLLGAIGGLCYGRILQPNRASACSLHGMGFFHTGPQAVNTGRWESHRPRFAQSSIASSWSARASNMVLMSSRMCLVDVPVGLQQGKTLMRWASGSAAKHRVLPGLLLTTSQWHGRGYR